MPCAVSPLKFVPREDAHEPPSRMLPPDIRCGSQDVHIGARSIYKGLDMDEHGHGHALVGHPVGRMTHKQILLKEQRYMQVYLESLDTGVQQDSSDTESVC